jgi:hypothetical protein
MAAVGPGQSDANMAEAASAAVTPSQSPSKLDVHSKEGAVGHLKYRRDADGNVVGSSRGKARQFTRKNNVKATHATMKYGPTMRWKVTVHQDSANKLVSMVESGQASSVAGALALLTHGSGGGGGGGGNSSDESVLMPNGSVDQGTDANPKLSAAEFMAVVFATKYPEQLDTLANDFDGDQGFRTEMLAVFDKACSLPQDELDALGVSVFDSD